MKIPDGLSNFKKVITEGFVYVDKTAYIAALEADGQYHFLLRPRRFGKSLFISALEYYYDIKHQADFEAIFSQLHIGQHPTPTRSSYQVLFMEFSGIATDSAESVERSFTHKVDVALKNTLERYAYPPVAIASVDKSYSSYEKMEAFFSAVRGQKIFLLIDEYDHFANSMLADDPKLFQSVMGKGGFVRSFYETIKTATQRGTVDRLFVTGVTPLMLDSMTSGFNIARNLSLHRDFNAAMGFTQTEVAALIQPLVETCQLDTNALLDDMAHWYNGYRFHPKATETVFAIPNHVIRELYFDYFKVELERSPYAVPHQHLIELKYAKKSEGVKGWETKREEGIAQVQRYLQLAEIAALPKLSAWVVLTDGEQVEVVKA